MGIKDFTGQLLMKIAGVYLMGIIFVAAGLNHFRDPGFYRPMMPKWLPQHDLLIVISGIAEIILGLLLFYPPLRPWAAWGIVLMLIAFFPVHIYMIQVRTEAFANIPAWFLVLRFFIQFALIYWAYCYTDHGGFA